MAQTRDMPPTGRTEDITGLSPLLSDGTRHTETLLIVPYGVRLTPYQAGTMCATRPNHSRRAADSLGASRPQSPVKGVDVYGERYQNIRPCDGQGKTDNAGKS